MPGRGRRRAPTARARRCARARSCWPRAASSPTRRCARPTSGRTGTWPRSAARRSTRARCCRRRSRLGAAPYGHWSGCHAIQWDRDAPPTGDLEITNRFSRQSYPVGIVGQRRRRALPRRGRRTSATTRYAKYGAEVLRQPSGWAAQLFDQRSAGLLRTIDYDAPGATRVEADTRRAALGRGAGHRRRAARADGRASTTPRSGRGDVRPRGQGRAAHDRAGDRQDQLGAGAGLAAVTSPSRSTCGITFTFGGLRVDADARVLDVVRAARYPACSPPASWSAACSSTTIRAAARPHGRRRLRPSRPRSDEASRSRHASAYANELAAIGAATDDDERETRSSARATHGDRSSRGGSAKSMPPT